MKIIHTDFCYNDDDDDVDDNDDDDDNGYVHEKLL